MRIFVPGRLCLFGEHSDWAGEYRRINPLTEKGYTLIVGTNPGLFHCKCRRDMVRCSASSTSSIYYRV